jgi:methylated-DNA-[protein]-cysteine S-methyltransferase
MSRKTESEAGAWRCLYRSPIGPLRLEGGPGGLRRIARLTRASRASRAPVPAGARAAVRALDAYFAGRAPGLAAVPLDLTAATPFQRRVWKALCRLPWGRTVSYAALAARAGSPRGARAAARALAANPVPILIPCHRVIRADGRLGGFGLGLDCKRFLLQHEGVRPLPR